jgi:Tfp pilus assembly PilM family ATPase
MDDFQFAVIDLLLTIERAAADILDIPTDEIAFDLVHFQANKVAIGESNLKVVATNSDDVLRRRGFVIGERPKAGRDGAFA